MPRVGDTAEDPFRVRHHNSDAAIGSGQAGNAQRRTIRVMGILLGDLAMTVYITRRDQSGLLCSCRAGSLTEVRAPFPVCHGYR